MTENIIETKQCINCGILFDITNKDRDFYDKISPTFGDKKYIIPNPTHCPNCRNQRRLNFRNERKLYHRKCDKIEKIAISMFSPDKPYTVYTAKEWFSDNWDAMEYGRDYNESKSFFEQFDQLLKTVPQIGLLSVGNENCDYNNFGGFNKNCYLSFDYGRDEDSSYLSRSFKNKSCIDLSYCLECENSYNLIDCVACTNSMFCILSQGCFDTRFCYNLNNCSNCFLCTNLTNKQYCILNKQYTKEEYEQQVQELLSTKKIEEIYQDLLDLIKKSIHKNLYNISCENVEGDYLKRCKDCKESYGAQEAENCKYVIETIIVNNIYDDNFSGNGNSYTLETIGCENLSNSKFCFSCRGGSTDLLYCHFCHSCKNCFGCAGLKNKEYYIFNKQYTKEEYEILVAKIINKMIIDKERGEFFPIAISPFTYNESLSQEYYPITKEESLKKGYKRYDEEYAFTVPAGTTLLQAKNLPNIKDVTDDILKQAIVCEITGRPFRIIKSELEYYRKNNLPLPTKHPDQRHQERINTRNPRKLRERTCAKCGTKIKTTYSPERSEIVYCETCYNKEIYG